MHRSGLTARCVPVLAVPLLAGAAAACSSAAAARAPAESPDLGASFSIDGGLYGATATSARSAWAVGYAGSLYHTSKTLIVRWNGSAWKRVPSPSPPSRGRASLTAVTATSADNAWAVGCANCFTRTSKTLILHWNGSVWTQEPSPGGTLSGVAAVSARSAWAVGHTSSLHSPKTLILHWNGHAWAKAPSLAVGGYLEGVAAISPRTAWAVGCTGSGNCVSAHTKTLIERWNGSQWKRVPSPTPARGGYLQGVTASTRSAWAVGQALTPGNSVLIERWHGNGWMRVPSAVPNSGGALFGVTAISARSTWAVGFTNTTAGYLRTLAERWNGTAWARVPTPRGSQLFGVTATPSSNTWAVGFSGSPSTPKTLILRWNGASWR